jgi:hypothetical protein
MMAAVLPFTAQSFARAIVMPNLAPPVTTAALAEAYRARILDVLPKRGYFSILKRGITSTYHHVSQQRLKRYLAEFDFRYNERAALGDSRGSPHSRCHGKRLMYKNSFPAPVSSPSTLS